MTDEKLRPQTRPEQLGMILGFRALLDKLKEMDLYPETGSESGAGYVIAVAEVREWISDFAGGRL